MRVARGRSIEMVAGVGWMLVLVCLLAQIATEAAMRTRYSPLADAISDLGVSSCTPRLCSPRFWMLDGSLILLGLCLSIGGWLTHLSAPRLWWGCWVATVALSAGGVGLVIAGAVPENVLFTLHVAGAAVGLVGGNLGTAFAGWALLHVRGHRHTGAVGILVGILGLAGSGLAILVFLGRLPWLSGLGGGLERVGVEPMLIVMAMSGGTLLLGEDVVSVAARRLRRSGRGASRSPA